MEGRTLEESDEVWERAVEESDEVGGNVAGVGDVSAAGDGVAVSASRSTWK